MPLPTFASISLDGWYTLPNDLAPGLNVLFTVHAGPGYQVGFRRKTDGTVVADTKHAQGHQALNAAIGGMTLNATQAQSVYGGMLDEIDAAMSVVHLVAEAQAVQWPPSTVYFDATGVAVSSPADLTEAFHAYLPFHDVRLPRGNRWYEIMERDTDTWGWNPIAMFGIGLAPMSAGDLHAFVRDTLYTRT